MDPECAFYLAPVTIDTTECRMHKWSQGIRQNVFYSFKTGATTVKYQLAVQSASGYNLNVVGAYAGSTHDRLALESSKIITWLIPHEKIIVVRGYEDQILAHRQIIGFKNPSGHQQCQWNNLIASVRSLIENINSYLKKFAILRYTYIKGIHIHTLVFHFLCHMVNIRTQIRPPRVVTNHNLMRSKMKKPLD